jgi:hypothetical protein
MPDLKGELDLQDIDSATAEISADDLPLPQGEAIRYNYRVRGPIPHLRQPSGRTCWAAVATMLGGWRSGEQLTFTEYLSSVGEPYADLFKRNRPLRRIEKEEFLRTAGFEFEWGQSFHPDGLESLLKNVGPVWFTVTQDDEFSKHATLVVAMYGTGDMRSTYVVFIDPKDGREHAMLYGAFMKKYEDVAFTQNLEKDYLESYQVVHYP